MPSIDRPLASDAMLFHLLDEAAATEEHAAQPRDSIARTLLKEGPLRVTLVILPKGGGMADHVVDGPITVQPLSGSVTIKTAGGTYTAGKGDLLAIGAGVRHEVSSEQGGSFLLTVTHVTVAG